MEEIQGDSSKPRESKHVNWVGLFVCLFVMFFQVSWHWKNLTELDQLWMLKCLRFNWYINFSPTPFEQGIWKKHYIQMVEELHVTKPKVNLGQKANLTNISYSGILELRLNDHAWIWERTLLPRSILWLPTSPFLSPFKISM